MNPDTLERWKSECGISRYQYRILKRLAEGPATKFALVNSCYFDHEDGGPLGADECIRQYIFHLNRKLEDKAFIKQTHLYELVLDLGTDKKGIIIP